MFDASDKVSLKQLLQLKDLAKASLQSYDISPSKTRVSVMSFAQNPKDIWQFKDEQSLQIITGAINDIGKINGNPDFDKVIKYIQSNVLRNIPEKENSILVLFTKGSSIDGKQVADVKKKLPSVKTIVVSIGKLGEPFSNFDIRIIKTDQEELPDKLDAIEDGVGKLIGIFLFSVFSRN